MTGASIALPLDPAQQGLTTARLHLPAFGSIAVIFSRELPAAFLPRAAEQQVTLQLRGNWKLTFQPNRGGPAAPLEVRDLKSWTESTDPAVGFFSGAVTYTATVEAPQHSPQDQVALQFASIREIARIRVNGVEAGTIWARPYRLDVIRFLLPGLNKLEIEVTNLWPNRLIGDLQPGVTHPITVTNITAYKPDSPLLTSGIIGPVVWILIKP